MAFNLQQNTGFGTTAGATPTFGGFGNTSTTTRGFGQASGGFGTAPTANVFGNTQTSGGFGTPQPSNVFGAPSSNVFGGPANSNTGTAFGTTPTSNAFSFGTNIGTSTGTSLFGNAPATGSVFGSAQPQTSIFQGFGNTNTFGAQSSSSGGGLFGGTGLQTSTANTGFGGFSFTGSKPATIQQPSSFGAFGGGLNTSLFGQNQAQSQFGLGAPQQQQQQSVPLTEDLAVKSVSLFGDDRDVTMACWNMLQARWGCGKGHFSQNMNPIVFNQQNKFCRFKAVGYSLLPTGKEEDGVVALIFIKKESEMKDQLQQLQSSLSQALLSGHPQYTLVVQGVRSTGDCGCQVLVCVTERTSTGQTRRITASELATFLLQAQSRGQLTSFGVDSIVPVVAPSPEWIRDYLACSPAGIDERLWKQALQDNPDPERCIPVPMVGFAELRARVRSQEAESSRHLVYLTQAEQKAGELRRAVGEIEVKLAHRRAALQSQQQRLLRLMVKLQAARRAGAVLLPVEEELRNRLEYLQAELSQRSQSKTRLGDILAQIRKLSDAQNQSTGQYTIDSDSVQELYKFLSLEQEGISRLMDVATSDRDCLRAALQSLLEVQGSREANISNISKTGPSVSRPPRSTLM